MLNQNKSILKVSLAAILGFILLSTTFHLLNTWFLLENEDNIIELSFSPELRYRMLSEDESGVYQFESELSKEELLNIDSDKYNLLIYRLTGQSYKVYFNDILIGSLGNFNNQKSNIWNAVRVFDIPDKHIQDLNQIRIEVFGEYELGLVSYPVMIMSNQDANLVLNYTDSFMNNILVITMGLFLFAIILLIFISRLSTELKKGYLFYALAALFMLINVIDYLAIYNYRIPIIYFKKIVILALYLGIFFYSLFYYKQFKQKINLVTSIILLTTILYAVVFKNSMLALMKFNIILLVATIINIIGYFYTSIKEYKNSYRAKVLFVLNLAILIDVINYFIFGLLEYSISFFPISFIISPISIILIVIYHYGEIRTQINIEKNRAELMYEKAITDTMTGTYNHQYLIDKLTEIQEEFVILMVDIDDFKAINDNYGHIVGDTIIIELAKRLKEELPDNIVGRYGGDEFIVILNKINLKVGKKIAKQIKKTIEFPYIIEEGSKLDISISLGLYYSPAGESGSKAVSKADDALYDAKENGKGKIIIYNQ